MVGQDQHEARFVLQVVSLWPDLSDEERHWTFQRLNVYCIVAALGWTAATAACASSTATTDFVLPPDVCSSYLHHKNRTTTTEENRASRNNNSNSSNSSQPNNSSNSNNRDNREPDRDVATTNVDGAGLDAVISLYI